MGILPVSYGKPLSVPQGVIGLFTRFGMDVTLAHPEGYDVFPEVEEIARKNCEKYGSKFHKTNAMKEALGTPTSSIRSPGRRSRLWKALRALCQG